jgi:hypothetical protein
LHQLEVVIPFRPRRRHSAPIEQKQTHPGEHDLWKRWSR